MLEKRRVLNAYMKMNVVFALLLTVFTVEAQAGECGLGLLGKPAALLSRGLNQKKIVNVMTDFYSEDQIRQFRKEERSIIDATFAPNKAMAKKNMDSAPGAERILKRIADRLLQQWPYSAPTYSIHLTTDLYVSPAVTEDHEILFPVGYLDLVQSDDEIAFLLGHELSHLLFLHAAKQSKKSKDQAALRKFKNVAGGALLVHEGLLKNEDGSYKTDRDADELRKLSERSLTYYEHSRSLFSEVIHPSWQLRQEDEADLLAVELMMKAGYSFEGIPQAFSTLEQLRSNACDALMAFSKSMRGFVDTEMTTAVTKLTEGQGVDVKSQLVSGFKSVSKRKIEDAMRRQALPKTHRAYKKRLAYIDKFVSRDSLAEAFDRADTVEPSVILLDKLKRHGEFKSLLKSAEAAEKMSIALRDGELDEAAKQLALVNQSTQYGRVLKYQLRRQQGKQDTAYQNLMIASQYTAPALEVYEKLIAYKLEHANFDQAKTLLSRAEKQFKDGIHFLPEYVYIETIKNKGNDAYKNKTVAKCLGAGRDGMQSVCMAASLGVNAHFREKAKQILEPYNCKVDKDTGSDVVCTDKASSGKKFGLPKMKFLPDISTLSSSK